MPRQFQEDVRGEIVPDAQEFYRIRNAGRMEPFFMSVMSSTDLWMYVSSTGALAAGRCSPEGAIFPYDTVDRIHAAAGQTGSFTVVRLEEDGGEVGSWLPFSPCYSGEHMVQSHIAKNDLGTRVRFEEINHTLDLSFAYEWSPSPCYGWVRRAELRNRGDAPRQITLLDGLVNIMPSDVPMSVQQTKSCLADAYRKSELVDGRLGIYTLASGIVDRAEACEVLRANVVWQAGLDSEAVLLSTRQLDAFYESGELTTEQTARARKGAYLGCATIDLAAGGSKAWFTVADANLTQSDAAAVRQDIGGPGFLERLKADIEQGEGDLRGLLHAADAAQISADIIHSRHHMSNVLFNCARGGVPVNNYSFPASDFADFLRARNRGVFERSRTHLETLPEEVGLHELEGLADRSEDPDFARLSREYLPLAFSRRHGDPSRPWNTFAIRTRKTDGSWCFDFQGNWRDIFQNWEALGRSFPELIERFITVFLNASTRDGFNPFRITREGIDWEVLDPDDPWSGIGYWGDHQIIYLLRLLEHSHRYHPGWLRHNLDREIFAYADVPYRIADYDQICADPYNGIGFDEAAHTTALKRAEEKGGDGKLYHQGDEICRVNLAEKLLVPILAKLSNFVPGGGIWMNTGRPEWNDANNALAGNGLSVVTACHLYRHLDFIHDLFAGAALERVDVSKEVVGWLQAVLKALRDLHAEKAAAAGESRRRKTFLDQVGGAFSQYRNRVYRKGFSGKKGLRFAEVLELCRLGREVLRRTIHANQRPDGLYHSYNLLRFSRDGRQAHVDHLYEMLEGQVAVLESGMLSTAETIELLASLRKSKLFRPGQNSYVLYPDRELPRFFEKNVLPAEVVKASELLQKLIGEGDERIIVRDRTGSVRFAAELSNAAALRKRLDELAEDAEYKDAVREERQDIMEAYEKVFQHARFTGRSGGMFGYEGLGCIYWHLVGKLVLAVNAAFHRTAEEEDEPAEVAAELKDLYYEIRDGLGFNKSPEEWGAYPLDAYSHTNGAGQARQPGMTGQVKEEILARWSELGVRVEEGCITFVPGLLRRDEFGRESMTFEYVDLDHESQTLELPADSIAFTCWQVPVIYRLSDQPGIVIHRRDGNSRRIHGSLLDLKTSQSLFRRTGEITLIEVDISRAALV